MAEGISLRMIRNYDVAKDLAPSRHDAGVMWAFKAPHPTWPQQLARFRTWRAYVACCARDREPAMGWREWCAREEQS